jgi:hypothetical protein
MINSVHAVIYSKEAEATRAFLQNTLGLRFADAGHGWLIFALPPAEVGVHPADKPEDAGRHQLYLMCEDIAGTIAELQSTGVEFEGGVSEQRWGRVASMKVPGAGTIGLYEPRHASPLGIPVLS